LLLNKLIILVVVVFSFTGCKNSPKELSAEDILEKTIIAHGGDSYNNSIITFGLDDLQYKLLRNNTVRQSEITRHIDSTVYKATYKNGYTQHYINDIEQQETYFSKKFIDARLDGFSFIFSIPHSLKRNSIKLKKLEDVKIKNINYYVVKATEEIIDKNDINEFIIYVNPKTFLVEYTAQEYDLHLNLKIFKRAHNTRTIENIVFSDYYLFKPHLDTTKLENLYKYFNVNDLKELNHHTYKSINVTLL